MLDPFSLPFVQRGLLELIPLAIIAGLLGTWIVARGLAFYTHAVAAATFPGLVLAGGLGFGAPLGALGAGGLFAASVGRLSVRERSGRDAVTALVLAGALAVGVVLASDVFHSGGEIDSLLFGSLLLVEPRDVALAAGVAAAALLANAAVGWRWLAIGFDRRHARALGIPAGRLDGLLLALVALAAVAALSAVGALLASALLVVPAVTTRLWAKRVMSWQLATALLAGLEGVAGLWLSVKTDAPPGATIAVLAGGMFALAALARAAVASR